MEDRGGRRERARDEQSPWKDGRPSTGWTPPRATCGTDEDGKRTQQSSPSVIRQAGHRSAMAPSAPEKAKRGYGRVTGSGACRPLRRPRTPGSRAASRSAWACGSLLWPSPRHCPAPGKAHLTPKSVRNFCLRRQRVAEKHSGKLAPALSSPRFSDQRRVQGRQRWTSPGRSTRGFALADRRRLCSCSSVPRTTFVTAPSGRSSSLCQGLS